MGINGDQLLSEEQTREFIRRAQAGDKSARNRLVEANVGLVSCCAKSLSSWIHDGIHYSDLVDEGYFGLFEAIKKFDLKKESKFSTYASYVITHRIMLAISQKCRTIRIPNYAIRALSLIKKARKKLTLKLGHEPSKEELEKEVNLPKDVFNYFVNRKYIIVSLDELIENEKRGIYEGTQELEIQEDNLKKIMKIIDGIKELSERDKKILYLRMGIVDGTVWTRSRCGKLFNITQEGIDEVEKRVLKHIRRSPQIFELAEYTNDPRFLLSRLEEILRISNKDDKVAFELNRFICDENNDLLRRKLVSLVKIILKTSIPAKGFSLKMGYLDGIEHSDLEIANILGISEEEVHEMNKKSLMKIKRSEKSFELINLDSRISEMIDKLSGKKNHEKMKMLRELLRDILKTSLFVRAFSLKMGYLDDVEYSDSEISNMLGISEEEVREMNRKSLEMIINSKQYTKLTYLDKRLLIDDSKTKRIG